MQQQLPWRKQQGKEQGTAKRQESATQPLFPLGEPFRESFLSGKTS
jgi:hypothetical protein